jgi:hypothetical protein
MIDDVHRLREEKFLYRGGHSQLFVRAGITLLTVIILSVTSVGVTPADEQPLPSMTIGYQNGTITAIYEKTLDIDGRTYGVTPDVVMLDEHGDMFDPARLRVSAEVKFHVTKEQSHMIDKMIVTLPK